MLNLQIVVQFRLFIRVATVCDLIFGQFRRPVRAAWNRLNSTICRTGTEGCDEFNEFFVKVSLKSPVASRYRASSPALK